MPHYEKKLDAGAYEGVSRHVSFAASIRYCLSNITGEVFVAEQRATERYTHNMAMYTPDKNARRFASVSDFIERDEDPSGRFSIKAGGLPIDFEYVNKFSETTVVFFHAALSSRAVNLPLFAGRGLSKELDANRLSISDPTLAINENLRLAWFAGSEKQPGLQPALSRIIQNLTRKNSHVIYFGASGGGFASLQFSARHKNSTAIAVNPQTNIARYIPGAVARWTNLAWGATNTPGSQMELPKVYTDLTKQYSRETSNRVIYIQNIGDKSHITNHLNPFSNKMNKMNRVEYVTVDVGKGHVPPSSAFLKSVLTSTISAGNDGQIILDEHVIKENNRNQ